MQKDKNTKRQKKDSEYSEKLMHFYFRENDYSWKCRLVRKAHCGSGEKPDGLVC